MWSEKHRPASVSGMIGNEESRAFVMEWLTNWRKGYKPLLLTGPPGVGKTTIAYVTAKHFKYDILSLNASDVRSKNRLNEILGPAMGNASVMGSHIIFIDEVDGIDGRGDYGGSAALTSILKSPTVPIILAANDVTADKMKNICAASNIVQFKKLSPRMLRMYLMDVLQKENITLNIGLIIKAIDKSNGDIRSMLNLAQSMATGFNSDVETSKEKLDIEESINGFFKAETVDEAKKILYLMEGDPRTKINAFYSTIISSTLDRKTVAKLFDALSEADILYGKILRTQNWRMLRYLNNILLKLYVNNSSIKYAQYNISWQMLNRIRWDGAKIKSFSLKMAGKLHMSSGAFAILTMPYMLRCIKNKSLIFDQDLKEHMEIINKEMR